MKTSVINRVYGNLGVNTLPPPYLLQGKELVRANNFMFDYEKGKLLRPKKILVSAVPFSTDLFQSGSDIGVVPVAGNPVLSPVFHPSLSYKIPSCCDGSTGLLSGYVTWRTNLTNTITTPVGYKQSTDTSTSSTTPSGNFGLASVPTLQQDFAFTQNTGDLNFGWREVVSFVNSGIATIVNTGTLPLKFNVTGSIGFTYPGLVPSLVQSFTVFQADIKIGTTTLVTIADAAAPTPTPRVLTASSLVTINTRQTISISFSDLACLLESGSVGNFTGILFACQPIDVTMKLVLTFQH